MIADPSLLEERRSEANVVFGINAYRELCGLHFGGITLASLELLIKCANQGAKRAKNVVKQIKAAVQADENKRLKGEPIGFMQYLQSDGFDSHKEGRLLLRLEKFQLNTTEEMEIELQQMKQEQARIKATGKHSAVLLPAEEITDNPNNENWIPEFDDDDGEDYEDDQEIAETQPKEVPTKMQKVNKGKSKRKPTKTDASDSEEEETIELQQIN